MYEEKYETLLDLVRKKKDWAVYNSIAHLGPHNRVYLLQSNFLQAADQHDDEKASVYWEFLKSCLWDVELLTFTIVERPETLLLPSTNETREAKSRAQASCAAKAKELWEKIPRFGVEKEYDRSTGRKVERNLPTLLETKKILLTEIATRWRDTKDEQEAANLFEFLVSIKPQHDEDKPSLDAIRKATDLYFPATRLSRCLAYISFPSEEGRIGSSFRREFEKILAIAWARNTDFKEISRLVNATLPLLEASDSAFDLLERQASKAAILDQKVSKLLKSMHGEIRAEGFEHIFGEKIVSYLDENHVEIIIIKKEKSSRSFSENAGHSSFEAARKHVDCWLKEYSGYSVHLKFMVVDEYEPKNRLFFREQILRTI